MADTINGQAMLRAMKPEFGTVDIWPPEAWDATKQQMKDSYWLAGGMVQTVDLQGAQVATELWS